MVLPSWPDICVLRSSLFNETMASTETNMPPGSIMPWFEIREESLEDLLLEGLAREIRQANTCKRAESPILLPVKTEITTRVTNRGITKVYPHAQKFRVRFKAPLEAKNYV